jgi:hypothetical protein
MAKNATSNAFIDAKKRKKQLNDSNKIDDLINGDNRIENIFEEQHHHLLSCLEHVTVN